MWSLFRHLAHEGPRHAGRQPSRELREVLFLHRPAALDEHYWITPGGWERFAQRLRPEVVAGPTWPGAVAQLEGGYLGTPVFTGECPCTWNLTFVDILDLVDRLRFVGDRDVYDIRLQHRVAFQAFAEPADLTSRILRGGSS